jgi:hypothetical protein
MESYPKYRKEILKNLKHAQKSQKPGLFGKKWRFSGTEDGAKPYGCMLGYSVFAG